MEQYESSATELRKRYDVFLSFRGPDVRKTLVDHLYEALSAAGLNVFLDSDKLKKGEEIWQNLERAIESSAIRIPIFSKGYADSVWCLKEAAAMLSTPGLIMPLFYYVDPTDVRYPLRQSSPYKYSFDKHYSHSDRHTKEQIDKWKDALGEISKRSGWSMDITGGFTARLVEVMVNDIKKLIVEPEPLEVAKHPVGLNSVKNSIIQKLNLNSVNEVVKVGIWGIGGIGKTTVAKAVYNQIYAYFDAASFVSDIGTTAADPTGLTNLQKKILQDLIRYNGNVQSIYQGISLYMDRLGRKRVLLILDDVVNVVQLHALVGDWLAPGSRVIITSRDKHVLNVATVSSIHEMSGLEINEGLQLFSWHAFHRPSPSPIYEDMSKRIVEACKGHPLTLEKTGSFLHDKQNATGCWIEALTNITLNPDIHKTLYSSYSTLSDVEKEIFVDIACFFIGEHKIFPIVFWKSLYEMVDTAICNLSMKLLIKIDNKDVLDMDDLLRNMGRTIVEKEKEGTRLWKAARLSTISNINFSRLRLNGGNPHGLKMLCRPGLRYLHLHNLFINGMPEDMLTMLPPSLIWLRLEDCNFAIGKNRVIKKPGHSSFVGNLQQLKTIQVIFCDGVDSLFISSLFLLLELQHLDLRGCRNLNNLSDTITNLSQLQHLYLGGCRSLNNLPHTIGNLSKLQHLNLKRCKSLEHLPDTIGNLSQLQHLDLGWCDKLNNLSHTIGNLSQLQHLDLRGCRSLKNLPRTIVNLSQLQYMNLRGFKGLNNLPIITNVSQLQHLLGLAKSIVPGNLEGCANLNNLSDTIGNISQLQHLDFERCVSLNNTSTHPRVEEVAPSTSSSAGSSMAAFFKYKPPTTKLTFQSHKTYHVFVSFRGPDVRKTLVDHLYEALFAAGVNVFLDSDKLEREEMIGLSLERAIESSVIRIPIFSVGYADSVWCLKEAAFMLSTPGLIIPLFYYVDPTDVRYPLRQSSPYKYSFDKHYSHSDRHTKEQIDKWKDALGEISKRSGWSMDITGGKEAQLVKVVVKDLLQTLDRVPLEVAKHPVGMKSVKNALIQKLNLSYVEEVVKVGMWGIGGIGKTTIAKAVYNQVYHDFDAASFVFDVRATAENPTGLTKLQKQILRDLSNYDKEVDSVDEGISLFRYFLGGQRVLLILDDVDAVVQLDALVGDWLVPGSRVIITSRDKHILNVAGVSCECIHEMNGLEINEGLQLFSWHAFLRESPPPSYKDMSERIVKACKGHPLTLEETGSFLYDKQNDTGCWTEALRKLSGSVEGF